MSADWPGRSWLPGTLWWSTAQRAWVVIERWPVPGWDMGRQPCADEVPVTPAQGPNAGALISVARIYDLVEQP